ncbi:MAG: TadE/TadG family type IV pilus assembly protein [Candidatus Nanopelagicales bacterium]
MSLRIRGTAWHGNVCRAFRVAPGDVAGATTRTRTESRGVCRNRLSRADQPEDRGAVAVEAALIFPVLVLMLFGIVEFSLFLRDHVALSAAVRSGARTASAEPRMSTFSADAAGAVLRAGTGMPFSSVEEMWVYESNAGGYPTNGGSTSATTGAFTSCTDRCVVFHYSGGSFTTTSDTWSHTLVNACPGDVDMTNVGVFIKANHRFVSGIFGNTVDITDHAVLRFEPIPASQLLQSGQCKP